LSYTSVSRVRGYLRPYADELSGDDIFARIEESEREVKDFLVACGFDPASLDTETSELARDLSTYLTCERLIPNLPIAEGLKTIWLEGLRVLSERIKTRFSARKALGLQKVRGIMKEIEEESKEL